MYFRRLDLPRYLLFILTILSRFVGDLCIVSRRASLIVVVAAI